MVKLGDYLCDRLYDAGIHHLFGVPGDFSLGLLNAVIRSKIAYVGTCNELNAAYAADGYARMKGIGCCSMTYAVGELSGINGLAGSYAERVPVVMLVGAPARRFYSEMPLLHHTLGDYMIPYKMMTMITCAQTLLSNPRKVTGEIDRVLNACICEKRPVYIAVPADMVEHEITLMGSPDVDMPLGRTACPFNQSNFDSLVEAVEEVAQRVNSAKRPLFIPGVEILRYGLENEFRHLIETTGIPYVTMLLSKGVIDEANENFVGLYSGNRSRPAVKKAVEDSDCVVIFGEIMTDFNTGGFTATFQPKSRILIANNAVTVSAHTYHQVRQKDMLTNLSQKLRPYTPDESCVLPKALDSCTHRKTKQMAPPTGTPLTMDYFFEKMAHYISEHSVVIAETGASLFSAAETMLPKGCTFIGQTFYGSIGYTLGSCLGVCTAVENTGRNVILFIGDGSFQVTGQDLSTMIRYNYHPTIFLLNNDGYTIERVITDNTYNDIQPWHYTQLPAVFGGQTGVKVKTQLELEDALANAKPEDLNFVEVILDKWDCNELLKSAGRLMAKNNNL